MTTATAAADMQEFTRLYLEEHYGVVTRLFHKYDAHHLLLGSRRQPGTANNEALVRIASKDMDVISVNYHTYGIEKDFLDRIEGWTGGKPMMLSEWHFTCGDQGPGGGHELASQHARGSAYRHYVETTAARPYVVGQQWFSSVDQAATGRWFEGFNGEGANVGLINVADRPYKVYLGDGPELFIGRDNPQEGGALEFSDRQVLIGASERPKVFFAHAAAQPTDVRTFAARNAAGDGDTLEAAIPWKDLGFSPANGQEILFDLGVDATSDRNTQATIREAQWMWSGGTRNSSDREAAGREFRLADYARRR